MAYYYLINNIPVAKSEKDCLNINNSIVIEHSEDIEDFENYTYSQETKSLVYSEELKQKNLKKKIENLKLQKTQELKDYRDEKINKLIVRTSTGKDLNANPISQEKFKSCILILNDNESEEWIDLYNNVITLTKEEFLEALRLAKTEETKIVKAYNNKRKELENLNTEEEIKNFNIKF